MNGSFLWVPLLSALAAAALGCNSVLDNEPGSLIGTGGTGSETATTSSSGSSGARDSGIVEGGGASSGSTGDARGTATGSTGAASTGGDMTDAAAGANEAGNTGGASGGSDGGTREGGVRSFGSIVSVPRPAGSAAIRAVDQALDLPAPQCAMLKGNTICLRGGIRP